MQIETEILVEIIKAGGSILTATIPSVVSFYLGRKLMNVVKLKQEFKAALNDIRFQLSLEDLHCREHNEMTGKSKKQTIRDAVKFERGLTWSGKFTLSQIEKKLEKLG